MNRLVWNPARELGQMLNRIEEGRAVRNGDQANADWSPAVDIRETDGAWLIHIDLPAVKAEDVSVVFQDGVLSVSGERPLDGEATTGTAHRIERGHGRFNRRFRLPETADDSRIEARTEHGVLRLTVPKREEVKPRAIEVQVH